jgi:hypothetical protein
MRKAARRRKLGGIAQLAGGGKWRLCGGVMALNEGNQLKGNVAASWRNVEAYVAKSYRQWRWRKWLMPAMAGYRNGYQWREMASQPSMWRGGRAES